MRAFVRSAMNIARSYVRIAVLVPSGGAWLAGALVVLNVILGLLPVAFILATSVMIGRVPAAVTGGVGSAEWNSLVVAFVLAAVAFVAQQILAPLQAALGELLARRDRRPRLSSGSSAPRSRAPASARWRTSASSNDLSQAVNNLEFGFRTSGLACAGLLALIGRYTQLLGCVFLVGLVFSWPAGLALLAATMVFRKGQRGGLRTYVQAVRGERGHPA